MFDFQTQETVISHAKILIRVEISIQNSVIVADFRSGLDFIYHHNATES